MNAASKRTSERCCASIERRLAPPVALGLLTIVCATHVAVPQEALLAELAAFPGADSEPEVLSNAAFAHHMLADAAGCGRRGTQANGRCNLDLGRTAEAFAAYEKARAGANAYWQEEIDQHVAGARSQATRRSPWCVP